MSQTTLYKVEGEAEGFADPLTELVRARTAEEAAGIVNEFLLYECGKPIQCQRFVVTPMCEPEDGIGIVYEPAGCDTSLAVEDGRLVPMPQPDNA
jgi:hypothetical protein